MSDQLKQDAESAAKNAASTVEAGATNIVKRNAKWFALGALVLILVLAAGIFL